MQFALEKSVCVLADDADITVLLIHKIFERLSSGVSLPNIYQLRVGVVYDMVPVTNVLPAALKNSLLLIHAFFGSDTTSRLYNHGYAAITSNKIPSKSISDVFYNKDTSMDEIFKAGDYNLMKTLYNCTKVDLDEQRYLTYCKKLGAGNVSKDKKKAINLAIFPPTSDSTRQHSLRVYHQVQVWRGEMKEPSLYGWQFINGSLCPIPITLDPALATLVNVQKCGCKTDCTGKCSPFKKKVYCTSFCTCNNDKCSNKPNQSVEDQEHDAW